MGDFCKKYLPECEVDGGLEMKAYNAIKRLKWYLEAEGDNCAYHQRYATEFLKDKMEKMIREAGKDWPRAAYEMRDELQDFLAKLPREASPRDDSCGLFFLCHSHLLDAEYSSQDENSSSDEVSSSDDDDENGIDAFNGEDVSMDSTAANSINTDME